MSRARISTRHGGVIFFFNDTATTEIYTLSLHDALPVHKAVAQPERNSGRGPYRAGAAKIPNPGRGCGQPWPSALGGPHSSPQSAGQDRATGARQYPAASPVKRVALSIEAVPQGLHDEPKRPPCLHSPKNLPQFFGLAKK